MRNHGADPSTRGAKLNEQLTALRALWTDEAGEFHGRQLDFEPIISRPRPSVPIPVYVGGSSRAALTRTVRLADGWMPLATTTTPDELAAAYFRASAETVLFHVEPGSSTDVLHALDALAVTPGRVRSSL